MAQLDPLLSALVEKNAGELLMSEGRPAALRLDGKLRPVSSKQLDRGQILRLLAELSDRVDAASAVTTPFRFFYELHPGQSFECRMLEQHGRLVARVSPARAPRAPDHTPEPALSVDRGDTPSSAPAAPAAPTEFSPPVPAEEAAMSLLVEPVPAQPTHVPFTEAPGPFGETAEPRGEAPEPFDATRSDSLATPQFEVDMSPANGADDVPPAAWEPFAAAAAPVVDEVADLPSGDVAPTPVRVVPHPASPAAVAADRPVALNSAHRLQVDHAPDVSAEPIERLLRHMVEMGASDLHLSSGETPMLRLHGEICRVEGASPVGPEAMVALLEPIMPERNRREFEETHDTDFAHEIPAIARFRANVFLDRNGRGGVFRMIPSEILTAEQLGLPEAVLQMCSLSKGLVLVTGPTGSGKSTTLAAMIDHINRTRTDHIITIEDPVEFVHSNRKCLVNQREVHTHTNGFKRALRAALREDPDIVLVGEMRDLETIAIAIETAETGHLVFGTLHTTTAISTVDRIIDQFPADRQAQIRTMLSESLKGVVAQTLLKKTGGGRIAALEVLVVTPAISNLIREGKTFQIPSLMQTGRKKGMRLLNDALMELVKSKAVEPDEAYRKAIDKTNLASALKSAGFDPNPPAVS